MDEDIHIRLDDFDEGKAALQDLLRLAAANIGDSHESPGSMGMETEVNAIVNEWGADPQRLWHRLGWFMQIAGAVAAVAARSLAKSAEAELDEPTDGEVLDALRDLEAAIEELLAS